MEVRSPDLGVDFTSDPLLGGRFQGPQEVDFTSDPLLGSIWEGQARCPGQGSGPGGLRGRSRGLRGPGGSISGSRSRQIRS